MSTRSEKASTQAMSKNQSPRVRISKIPSILRFPLLITLSLTLSTVLHTFCAEYISEDLAGVSRSLETWSEVGVLLSWRTFELGLGWFGGYDGYDLAALSLLSRGPPLYLLGSFYGVRRMALTTTLLIDTLTTYIPFRLLRPISAAHMVTKDLPSAAVPNRDVVADYTIQTITSLLVASIYSVTLYGAYQTYLPTHLVTYFEGISSVTAAHSATPISLTPITLILGLACKSFIFTPAAALPKPKTSHFDPGTATFSETFWYNVWGFNSRTKAILTRTLALMLVSGVNTFVQTYVTIEGVEMTGAASYSAIWAVAGGLSGIALGVVGAV